MNVWTYDVEEFVPHEVEFECPICSHMWHTPAQIFGQWFFRCWQCDDLVAVEDSLVSGPLLTANLPISWQVVGL